MIETIIKDLRNQFGDIRDQGQRPTCIAFATSDCHSFAENTLNSMSVEYAFYHAVQRTTEKNRQKGVSFRNISKAVEFEGQPIEEEWKYIRDLSATDDWKPPKNLGTLFRRKSEYISSDLDDVFTNLDKDNPVIIVTEISSSFYFLTGDEILNASLTEAAKGIHAIIGVGYRKTKKGKCILIRNSWGKGWADSGHGWIHEDYLKPRLQLIATIS